MTERSPSPPQPDVEHDSSWDPETVGAALGASPDPIRDGYRFTLEREAGELRLELYPTGFVRLSTSETELLCFGLAPPIITAEEQIVLHSASPDGDELELTITAAGDAALLMRSHLSEAAESAQSDVSPAGRPSIGMTRDANLTR